MKTLMIMVSLFIGLTGLVMGQSSFSKNDLQAIKDNFKKQEECWNQGDHECYVEAYFPSENVQTVSRGGVTKGYKNILASYKRGFPKEKMGKLHFDNFSYKKLSRKYAYVVGRFNLKYEDREKPRQGWFSVIMEKIDGQWFMISDHSS